MLLKSPWVPNRRGFHRTRVRMVSGTGSARYPSLTSLDLSRRIRAMSEALVTAFVSDLQGLLAKVSTLTKKCAFLISQAR
jgi:hypothetical protein